jgi:nuclear pore complex protein Nup205
MVRRQTHVRDAVLILIITAYIPTIGDALEALDTQLGALAEVLKAVNDLSAELAQRDHVRAEDVYDLVHLPDTSFLDDLDVRQKKALVLHEVGQAYSQYMHRARNLVSTLEMLLLLIWRHLAVFTSTTETEDIHPLNRSALGKSTIRPPSGAQHRAAFRAEVAARMRPLLSKMDALEIVSDLPRVV